VDFPNWWFLARLSQTEPVLRLSIEAKTKKLMAEKKKELSSLITRAKRSVEMKAKPSSTKG